ACGGGQNCVAGVCTCSDGSPVCNGLCTSVTADNNNCGACGNVCGAGQSCVGGVCQGGSVTGSTGTTTTTTTSTTTSTTSTTGMGGSTSTSTTDASTTGTNSGTPPGWWTYAPLNWQGCAWTGIDSTVQGSTTTIVPQDFTA